MVIKRVWQLLTWRFQQIGEVWWILIITFLLVGVLILVKYKRGKDIRKASKWCALASYSVLILFVTVLARNAVPDEYERVSFDISTAWTIGPGIYGKIDTYSEMIMNILMFFPFGYLLGRLFKKPIIALGTSFLITLSIETLQLVTKRGFFELPDILLNMIGAVIGYYIAAIVNKRESNGEAGKKDK